MGKQSESPHEGDAVGAPKQRIWKSSLRAMKLVWEVSPRLTFFLAFLTLVSGLLPAAIAMVGKELVDCVVAMSKTGMVGAEVYYWLGLELLLVLLAAASKSANGMVRSLFRARLGHHVNVLILEKALQLELVHFEDADLYDQMTRARREASSRPLSLVSRTFDLIQGGITLSSYAVLLVAFSPLALLLLVLAGLPSFFSEAYFAGHAFRLFTRRTPEARELSYLETVMAREDHAKEVKLFELGRPFLGRYKEVFQRVFKEDRALTIKRGLWTLGLGVLSTLAFYGAYVWIAIVTITGVLTLGAMTMYLAIFRQGQSSLGGVLTNINGVYEDNLYLVTLFDFLDIPLEDVGPTSQGAGPLPQDGFRFENVSFLYPDATEPSLKNVSFHIPPGAKLALVGENGSGKTTIVKLLARFYTPSSGRILYQGRDLRDWHPQVYREKIGVIFQDFVRYQMDVGTNIGAGDASGLDDEKRWAAAAEKGLASPFIDSMEKGYHTQLGRWFKGGRELSLGQWQKIALSRAFMRENAEIVVLDEPTASIDAGAEKEIFQRFREFTEDQIALVISHRFSTVRMADQIIVLDHGEVLEQGSHDELLEKGGRYAALFELQAEGYR